MKTDVYTKVMLSLIAGALIVIAFQNVDFIPKANASKSTAAFVSIPVNSDGSINVKMMDNMKVDISAVGGSSIYGALPINMKELAGSNISSYGLPVNIQSVNGSSIYDGVPVKMKN
jgi:hypothetical protein